MKWLNLINQNSNLDKLNRLFLLRLAYMEKIAAYKFRRLPIEDKERENKICSNLIEQCNKQNLSSQKTAIIISIFKENFRLSKNLQFYCFDKWEQEKCSLYQAPTQSIETIRYKLDILTNELADYLISLRPTINPSLRCTQNLLLGCFPGLSQQKLSTSISIMEKLLGELISKDRF